MEASKAINVERIEAGERLREKREATGTSVPLMAVLLDCTVRTIENYEGGKTAKLPGSVVFAYDNIDCLKAYYLARGTLTCGFFDGSQDPLPFPQDDDGDIIDLREHILNQTAQKDSLVLYANAG